jgi:hypothetical protein
MWRSAPPRFSIRSRVATSAASSSAAVASEAREVRIIESHDERHDHAEGRETRDGASSARTWPKRPQPSQRFQPEALVGWPSMRVKMPTGSPQKALR